MALTVALTVQSPITNPVTRDKLNALVSTATGTVSGTLPTAQIENGAVTAAKLGAAAVEEAKLADGAVATAKLADGAVTAAKLVGSDTGLLLVRGAAQATKTDTQTTNLIGQWVDATGLSAQITLRDAGSKVLILGALVLSGSYAIGRVVRNGVPILQGDAADARTPAWSGSLRADAMTCPFVLLDAPGSVGPHTYKVQFATVSSSDAYINRAKDTLDGNFAASPRTASSLVILELFAMP